MRLVLVLKSISSTQLLLILVDSKEVGLINSGVMSYDVEAS